jgi:hypothetical protein
MYVTCWQGQSTYSAWHIVEGEGWWVVVSQQNKMCGTISKRRQVEG